MKHELDKAVAASASHNLSLTSIRGNVLHGLCAQLGVNEIIGSVSTTVPQALNVQFAGENGTDDDIRREWFSETTAEMMGLDRGLFMTKDAGRTLQPNPHSATATDADHLPYFALLGGVAGMALYHREYMDMPCCSAFLKVVFGFDLEIEDFQSVDPELYISRVEYLRDKKYAKDGIDLATLDLRFVDDSNDAAYTTTSSVELIRGGAKTVVTDSCDRQL